MDHHDRGHGFDSVVIAKVTKFDSIKEMKKSSLKSVVWQEGKYFVAQCLNIDVSSFGETKAEALANLKEALELYLEDASPRVIYSVERPELVTL